MDGGKTRHAETAEDGKTELGKPINQSIPDQPQDDRSLRNKYAGPRRYEGMTSLDSDG